MNLTKQGIHQDFLRRPVLLGLTRTFLKDQDRHIRGGTCAVRFFREKCQIGDLQRGWMRFLTKSSNIVQLKGKYHYLAVQAGNVCHFLSSQGTCQMEEGGK